MVSIPSSRVGTSSLTSPIGHSLMFPSPQVGSGQIFRNIHTPNIGGFHPLKSGRDGEPPFFTLCKTEVSIPSSRVGTYSKGRASCFRFVSIPSSRVGTRLPFLFQLTRTYEFPSPQVGSGPRCILLRPHLPHLFPSPQVGSGPRCFLLTRRGLTCFHPLKSGRDIGGTSFTGCSTACFHPLKSGRDYNSYTPYNRDRIVSIPSSRVGTTTPTLPTIGIGSFPSPQVGSGPARCLIPNHCPTTCFHPLKSGRDYYRRNWW